MLNKKIIKNFKKFSNYKTINNSLNNNFDNNFVKIPWVDFREIKKYIKLEKLETKLNLKDFNFKNFMKNSYYCNIFFLFIKKLLGNFIKCGNKIYSFNLLNKLKYTLKSKSSRDSNLLIFLALLKSTLKIFFIKKKLGGSVKDIPMPIGYIRQIGIIVKFLIKVAKSRRTRNLNINNLSLIIFLTNKTRGPMISRKYRAYKKALENRFLLYLIRK